MYSLEKVCNYIKWTGYQGPKIDHKLQAGKLGSENVSKEINDERREHSALGLNEGENLLGSKPLGIRAGRTGGSN